MAGFFLVDCDYSAADVDTPDPTENSTSIITRNNKLMGTGRYKWGDGSSYEGGIGEGLRNGYGTFASADGTLVRPNSFRRKIIILCLGSPTLYLFFVCTTFVWLLLQIYVRYICV